MSFRLFRPPTSLWLFTGVMALLITPGHVDAQGFWSPPVTVSATGNSADVAVDGSGNAVAVWSEQTGSVSVVRVGRYSAAAGTWSDPVDLTAPGQTAYGERVAVDRSGNAVIAWDQVGTNAIVQAAYSAAGTSVWSGTVSLSAAGQDAHLADVGIDDQGNAVALWTRFDGAYHIVQAARFTASTATWDAPADLSPPGIRAGEAALAVESTGRAVAAWVLGVSQGPNRVVQVARYDVAPHAWGVPANVAAATSLFEDLHNPSVAIDVSGNVVALWTVTRPLSSRPTIQMAFYTAATGTWTPAADLSLPGTTGEPRVVMDAGGHAIAIWAGYNRGIETRRYSPGTGWGPTLGLSAPGDTKVYGPRIAIDGNGNAVAGWEVYDDFGNFYPKSAFFRGTAGAWTGSVDLPPEGSSQRAMAIGGGDKVVAVWVSGQWPATVVRASTAAVPAAPLLQPAAVNRPNVTLSWMPPGSGPAPTAYAIVASLSPDGPTVATLPVGTLTSVMVQAPDGVYFVRVFAAVAGTAIPSNQVAVLMAPPPPPTAPLGLGATVMGSTITLSWSPPANAAVAPVQTYVIEAGSAPGLVNLASFATGNSGTTYVTPPVPDGSYYVRLRARNESGTGPATGDLRVVVGPPPPGPPTLSGTTGAGGYVSLTWTRPTTGAAVTGYQLQAGTAPGLTNTAVVTLPPAPEAFVASGVPPGTYYVRVVATSVLGLGFESNEVVLTVP